MWLGSFSFWYLRYICVIGWLIVYTHILRYVDIFNFDDVVVVVLGSAVEFVF